MLSKSLKNSVNYDDKLLNTLENYRLGCVKPIELSLGKYGDLFTQTLYTLMKSRLSLTDQVVMQKAAIAREDALIAVRRQEFALAEKLFALSRAPLESNSLSLEASLLHRSLLEQSESYLDYRRGDFKQVYTRTCEALAIDSVLEDEYGYSILHIHRIQLLHNLVRTKARCTHFNAAIELASQLLGYLEGRNENLPFPGIWGSERVASQSREIVAATFAQIASEIAIILAGKDLDVASQLLAIVLRHIPLHASSYYCGHPRAYAWLSLKHAFVNNDIDNFLEAAPYFLVQGRTDTPLLWYATVVDVVAIFNNFNFPNTELLKQEIASDALEWKFLPPKFLSLLKSPISHH